MKKFLSVLLAGVVSASALALSTAADSYNPSSDGKCDIAVTVKKANPANVVKDGVIGNGEYEEYKVDFNELTQVYGKNTEMIEPAEDMVKTMKYYFSWDETHGFNFAVVCTPGITIAQNIPQGTGEKPGDDFLNNVGLQMELNPTTERGEQGLLYYAISKNPATNEYLKGYYGQLGESGAYNPTAGEDFAISYGSDGSVTYEWSVPFAEFKPGAAAGDVFGFSVGAYAGTCTVDTLLQDVFGVAFGDFCYAVKQDAASKLAVMTLSADEIAYNADNPDTPNNPDNPQSNPSNPGAAANPGVTPSNPSGGNSLNESVSGSGNSGSSNGSGSSSAAPQTGDAAMILAAVSALSACGIAFTKKRRG